MIPGGLHNPIGLELLKPTRIYVKPILKLLRKYTIKGIVHITGGGFIDNTPPNRSNALQGCYPKGILERTSQLFGDPGVGVCRRLGDASGFQYGIGIILVVSSRDGADMVDQLNRLGETACLVGTIEKRPRVTLWSPLSN
jgi:phosphoribosylformylglycinamidine cyclo-ligase